MIVGDEYEHACTCGAAEAIVDLDKQLTGITSSTRSAPLTSDRTHVSSHLSSHVPLRKVSEQHFRCHWHTAVDAIMGVANAHGAVIICFPSTA